MSKRNIFYLVLGISILGVIVYVFGLIKSPNVAELRKERETIEQARKEAIRETTRQQRAQAQAESRLKTKTNSKPKTIKLEKPVELRPIGLTYNDVMQDLTDYFPEMSQSKLLNGKTRYLGQSTGGLGLAGLEIIGPKNNILQALLMVACVSDLSAAGENLTIYYIFLKNVAPELNAIPNWRSQLTDAAFDEPDIEHQVIAGDKAVLATFNTKLTSLIFVVRHK